MTESQLKQENEYLKQQLDHMKEVYKENMSLHMAVKQGEQLRANLNAYLREDDRVYSPRFITPRQKGYIAMLFKKHGLAPLSKAKRKVVMRLNGGGLLSEHEAHQVIQMYEKKAGAK
ncbi:MULTISPECIES: hypothetical protein [Bacillus]|uniref:hypothetical protein n=1 Tax=Bacillus TaxID=1386 RepID=UPI000467264C|nr:MULTISPECIES: hypothetical protein [Bacillus]AIX06317.1 hypothetical protein OB04_00630 [Bacillus subtilis]MBA5716359.1 hypothetical protein [Bacillus subtilis]MBU8594036.1 hypothetical protein [Bacillus subtilis]MDI6580827.1 hypothetical protein [Bacillus subtilis]MDR4436083.1 hypothetical protein [Bacillus tequilensis]